jgi:hypothetical protein
VWASGESVGDPVAQDLVLAEHQILLRGEVAKERAPGQAGGSGDVVDRGLLVALRDEEVLRDQRQLGPHSAARALLDGNGVALRHGADCIT